MSNNTIARYRTEAGAARYATELRVKWSKPDSWVRFEVCQHPYRFGYAVGVYGAGDAPVAYASARPAGFGAASDTVAQAERVRPAPDFDATCVFCQSGEDHEH